MQKKQILIAPSLLSADFCHMADAVAQVESDGADMLHCDVMDGVFVPNITFGPKMIADIRKVTALPLDVHLMIVNPEKYVDKFAAAGANIITFHMEAASQPIELLKHIRSLGVKCGAVISPDTPVDRLEPVLDWCDQVLLMSVYPGFGGQKFIPNSLERLTELTKLVGNRNINIEIDGGINLDNVAAVKKAGANVIVAGNTVFGAASPRMAIEALKYL